MPIDIALRPDADSVDGNWTRETGSNVDLFASLDETTADDGDYIQSGASPVADICRIGLSDPGGMVDSTGTHTLRYRLKADTANETLDVTVRLMQGASTEIASWSHAGISTTETTHTQVLTAPQIALITNYQDLFVEFEANVQDATAPIQSNLAFDDPNNRFTLTITEASGSVTLVWAASDTGVDPTFTIGGGWVGTTHETGSQSLLSGNTSFSGPTATTPYGTRRMTVYSYDASNNLSLDSRQNWTHAAVPSAFVDADWSVATGSGGGQLDVTIATLPNANGDTITDVEYDLDASGSWISSGGTTSFTISGLTASTSYAVRLRAINGKGAGAAGNSESATSGGAVSGATYLGKTIDGASTTTVTFNNGGDLTQNTHLALVYAGNDIAPSTFDFAGVTAPTLRASITTATDDLYIYEFTPGASNGGVVSCVLASASTRKAIAVFDLTAVRTFIDQASELMGFQSDAETDLPLATLANDIIVAFLVENQAITPVQSSPPVWDNTPLDLVDSGNIVSTIDIYIAEGLALGGGGGDEDISPNWSANGNAGGVAVAYR